MEHLIIKIKDSSKLAFLMQFFGQLDYVEVEQVKKKKPKSHYNFFLSAGLWSNRDVDAIELRKQAWNRQK